MLALLGKLPDEQFSVIGYVVERLGLPESWSSLYLDVVTSILVAVLIAIASLLIWRRTRKVEQCLLPDDRMSLVNIFEIILGIVMRMMTDAMGERNAKRHFPLIAPLFIYLLASNLIGLIPGFYPPTENINTNLPCALIVFVYYNYVGIREQGWRAYFGHMMGPIVWLAPLLFAIEIVSHVVRPVSLSVRLFGNMAGDHIVLEIFSNLVPLFLPIVFMGLAIFISILQAFIFTLLSIVYIQMASAPLEEGTT